MSMWPGAPNQSCERNRLVGFFVLIVRSNKSGAILYQVTACRAAAEADSITAANISNTGGQMSTMTTKGQVTVPKPMREALGLKPGSKVVFEYAGAGRATIRGADKPRKSKFAKVRGSLKDQLSTDQIMALLLG